VVLTGLVGIYTGIRPPDYHAIRFVFAAKPDGPAEPIAGDEILAVRWLSAADVAALPDAELVGAARFRRILADAWAGSHYPLSLLVEPE
jgi:hypothetical protein